MCGFAFMLVVENRHKNCRKCLYTDRTEMEKTNDENGMDENLFDELNKWFENRPSKDVYNKALLELLVERANITKQPDYDREYVAKIDEVIHSIQVYLSVATK